MLTSFPCPASDWKIAIVFVLTENLTKAYPGVVALDGCSLQVRQGEVFGLLGPNGAGKTTLIRLLLGYLRPTQGVARIGGLDCVTDSVRVRQLGGVRGIGLHPMSLNITARRKLIGWKPHPYTHPPAPLSTIAYSTMLW